MLTVLRKWTYAAVAVSAGLLVAAPAAEAGGPDPPVVDDLSGTVTTVLRAPAGARAADPAVGGSGEQASLDACTSRYDPTGMAAENFDFSRSDAPTSSQLTSGEVHWYSVSCPGQAEYPIFTAAGPPAPGPPPPTTRDLAAEARRVLKLPFPSVRLNPSRTGLVNLPTWLWLDGASWQVRSSTLTLRGTSVTVIARPTFVTWVTGDGATVVCSGPGVAYDPHVPAGQQSTYCSHTYRHSSAGQVRSAYAGRATATWQVRWVGAQAGGPAEQGDLPELDLTSRFALRVAEVQDLVTRTA